MSEQRKDTTVWEIEDLVTAVKIYAEQCNCILDVIGTFFNKETLSDDDKPAFLACYRKLRILLDVATDKSAEALDNLEHWEDLSPRLKSMISNATRAHENTADKEQLN